MEQKTKTLVLKCKLPYSDYELLKKVQAEYKKGKKIYKSMLNNDQRLVNIFELIGNVMNV